MAILKRLKTIPLVAVVVSCAMIGAARDSYAALGKISGSVKGAPSGPGLVGANVFVEATRMGATTDPAGLYFILNVPPGTYRVTASILGYRPQTATEVVVRSDATTELDFVLEEAPLPAATPTTVVAQRPAIDRTLTATRTTFGPLQLDNTLPVNDIYGIAATTAGWFRGHLRGGHKSEVKTLVDGFSISDPYFSGGTGTGVYQTYTATRRSEQDRMDLVGINSSSALELNLLGGTFNAEYDAAGSGILSVASKAGLPKLGGKLFLKSAFGGLKHAGPDAFDGKDSEGRSDWDKYRAERDRLLGDTSKDSTANRARGLRYGFPGPGDVPYGNGNSYTAEAALGGPLGGEGGFFLTGRLANLSGRLPNELERSATATLKAHFALSENMKLAGSVLLDDGGIIGGWKNRSFTQQYKFFDLGNARRESLGLMAYGIFTHVLSPRTFYELRVGQNRSTRRWGYSDDDGDGFVESGEDGDFVIIDTKAKVEKYLGKDGKGVRSDGSLTFFNTAPLNDASNVTGFGGNQLLIDRPGFYYEDLRTGVSNMKADLTSQANYHHQIKMGAQFRRHAISEFQQRTQIGVTYQPDYPFEWTDYDVHPLELSAYAQDRIEYEGMVVNAGLRLEGFDVGVKQIGDFFAPVVSDTLSRGDGRLVVRRQDRTKEIPIRWQLCPRIGVSHPISDRAAMHYAWGYFFQPPQFSDLFENFGVFSNPSVPVVQDVGADPEKITAYEMGMQLSVAAGVTADVTAYYRDIENYNLIAYSISPVSGSGFPVYTYVTSFGYADSRGVEISLEKSPGGRVSGRASYAYSYIKSAANAEALSPNRTSFSAASDLSIPFEDRRSYNTYERLVIGGGSAISSGYDRTHRLNVTLLADLPPGLHLSAITSAASGFSYLPLQAATQPRSRDLLTAPWNLRTDARLEKPLPAGMGRVATVFLEVRNLFDRSNVLTYDNFNSESMRLWDESMRDWRADKIDEPNPRGSLNRATTNDGVPIYDIAREVYVGLTYSF